MTAMTFCRKCSASVASRKGTVQSKAGRITFEKTALTHVPFAVSKGIKLEINAGADLAEWGWGGGWWIGWLSNPLFKKQRAN